MPSKKGGLLFQYLMDARILTDLVHERNPSYKIKLHSICTFSYLLHFSKSYVLILGHLENHDLSPSFNYVIIWQFFTVKKSAAFTD